MALLPTNQIGLSWHDKITSVLSKSMGVLPLSAVNVVSALLCGLACFLHNRVAVEIEVWSDMVVALGPIWCLFMVGFLLVAFFRNGRQHQVAFVVGLAFGLTAFAVWAYCGLILNSNN